MRSEQTHFFPPLAVQRWDEDCRDPSADARWYHGVNRERLLGRESSPTIPQNALAENNALPLSSTTLSNLAQETVEALGWHLDQNMQFSQEVRLGWQYRSHSMQCKGGRALACLEADLGERQVSALQWPMGKSLAEAEELTALARAKTAVPWPACIAAQPSTCRTVNDMLDSRRTETPLSITETVSGLDFLAEDLHSLACLSDSSTGESMVTIHFSHSLDTTSHSVG